MADNNSLPKGTRLQSDSLAYTIENVLGSGGFGITYCASFKTRLQNLNVKASVAIKEHFPAADCERDNHTQSITFSRTAAARVNQSLHDFISEANCLKNLAGKHPNIVNVNEVFEANNTAYYVMDYLEGESLKEYVAANGPLTPEQTIALMGPVVDAVAMLHRNNFTHLDIKPANIMLTSADGILKPVVIDFGMAKHYNSDGSATSTVQSGGFSDGYAPVEQYAGIMTFSPAVDVYALGATMLFCLTGNTPPRAVALTRQELSRLIPAGAPKELRNIILSAMTFQASDRIPDAAVLYRELADAARDTGAPLTPAGISFAPVCNRSHTAAPETTRSHANGLYDPDATSTLDNYDPTVISQPYIDRTPVIASPPHINNQPPAPYPPKKSVPTWVWILIALLIVALGGAVIYKLLSDNSSDRNSGNRVEKLLSDEGGKQKTGRKNSAPILETSEVDKTKTETPKTTLSPGDVTPDLGFQFLSGPVKSCKNQWGAEIPFDAEGNWTGTWHDYLGPRKFYRDSQGRIVREEYNSDKEGHGYMTYEWSGNRVMSLNDPVRNQYVEYTYNSDGTHASQTNYLADKTMRYSFSDYKFDRYGNWTSRSFNLYTENDDGTSKHSSGTQKRTISYY